MPRWPNRGELLLVILVLGVMLAVAGKRILDLQALLAAKPQIQVQWRDRVVTKTVKGPERIVTRTVREAGGAVTIIKEVVRDEVVKTTDADRSGVRTETPVCPPVPRCPSHAFGATFDPLTATKIDGVRASMTVFDHVEAAAGYRFLGRANGPHGDVSYRW